MLGIAIFGSSELKKWCVYSDSKTPKHFERLSEAKKFAFSEWMRLGPEWRVFQCIDTQCTGKPMIRKDKRP